MLLLLLLLLLLCLLLLRLLQSNAVTVQDRLKLGHGFGNAACDWEVQQLAPLLEILLNGLCLSTIHL